jgi:hypothetical protein
VLTADRALVAQARAKIGEQAAQLDRPRHGKYEDDDRDERDGHGGERIPTERLGETLSGRSLLSQVPVPFKAT